MTPTTTLHSGPSTDASRSRVEALLGELSAILSDDPYWPIVVKLYRLLSRKRNYYGCGQNPLENALGVREEGIEPWKYQLARIGEKCRRCRGPLRTIDIQETLSDIAGHAVVGIAVLNADPEGNTDESEDR